MITEKQFLKAIDIINNYQIQINQIVNNSIKIHNKKTDFLNWAINNNISSRLQKAIKYNYETGKIKYIEDIIQRSDLQKLRQFGRRSIDEFFYTINNNK